MSASTQNQGRSNPSPGSVEFDDGYPCFDDSSSPERHNQGWNSWKDDTNGQRNGEDLGMDTVGNGHNDHSSTFKDSEVRVVS
jgi:hypothetical protein